MLRQRSGVKTSTGAASARMGATAVAAAALALTMGLLAAGCSSASSGTTNGTDNSLYGASSTKITKHIYSNNQADQTQTFKEVSFGSYQGDDITWYVLDEQDGKTLLISKYVLDAQPYDDGEVLPYAMQNIRGVNDVTWQSSSLRTWLNQNFYKAAFSSDEQAAIQETTLTDSRVNAPSSATDPLDTSGYHAPETTDKVFLPSTLEAKKYMINMDARCADPTSYALAQGVFTGVSFDNNDEDDMSGKAAYWLRTTGYYAGYAAVVLDSGEVQGDGYRVDGEVHDGFTNHGTVGGTSELGGNFGVRPCIWVDSAAL